MKRRGYTERGNRVLSSANREAQRLNHEYIGTEHLLLAMLKDADCLAVAELSAAGVDALTVLKALEQAVLVGPDMVTMGRLPLTPRAKLALEHAVEEARGLGCGYVGPEHILLGLLRDKDGLVPTVMKVAAVDVEQLLRVTRELYSGKQERVIDMESRDTLTGTVESIGGEQPQVKFRIVGNILISAETNKLQAVELGAYLFKKVRFELSSNGNFYRVHAFQLD